MPPTSLDSVFAAGVRLVREARGLSQAGVAREMSRRGHTFHAATMFKIEAGKRKVTVAEAADLADILGVTLPSLLDPGIQDDSTSTRIALEGSARNLALSLLQIRDALWTFKAERIEMIEAGRLLPADDTELERYRLLLDWAMPDDAWEDWRSLVQTDQFRELLETLVLDYGEFETD